MACKWCIKPVVEKIAPFFYLRLGRILIHFAKSGVPRWPNKQAKVAFVPPCTATYLAYNVRSANQLRVRYC